MPDGYPELLEELKGRIRSAQFRAAVAVNRELTQLDWGIGQAIVERQEREGWGESVGDRLAADLQREFPGISGFSPSNIRRMRAFDLAYTREVANLAQPVREMDGRSLPEAVAAIPWGHNIVLVEKLTDPLQRLWYARATVEHSWSRAVLVHQIDIDPYRRKKASDANSDS